MKKFLAVLLLMIALPLSANAIAVSWDRPSAGRINPLFILDTVFGNRFTATSTTQASIFPFASTTVLSATTFCLTGDLPCRTSWGGGGTLTQVDTTYPVLGGPITTTGTISLAFGTTTINTWVHQIFTSLFATNATTTNATTTGSQYFPFIAVPAGSFLATDPTGKLIATTSPSSSGLTSYDAWTHPQAGTSATTSGMIFSAASSTFVGGLSINTSTTTSATTTNLFVTNPPTFSTLTSALLQTGAGGLLAEYAGTSCSNSFTRALSALGIATCEQVNLASDVTGTLTVPNGGTGATTFPSGVIYGNGTGALFSTSSPTVGWITATTTTATSTFAGNAHVVGNLRVDGNFFAPVSIVSSGNAVINGNLNVTGQTTLATSLSGLAQLASGVVSAVTGTAGQMPYYNGTNTALATSTLFISTASKVGVGTTTPWAKFSVGSGGAAVIGENRIATSTTISLSWLDGNQQLVRMGSANTTINFSNYIDGQILRVVLCNPAGTSGTITWDANVLWSAATVPTKTTTANKCDLYTFIATQGTSTLKVFGGQVPNF